MAAYMIVEVTVADPALYDQYRSVVGPTLEQYGGRFLVRGGKAELLEGDQEPGRIVILEFDSVERAKAWYDSEEYREPKRLRMRASTARLILVEGV